MLQRFLGNDDAAEMEAVRQQLTRDFWAGKATTLTLFSILGAAFLFVGLAISPLDACRYPWPIWYNGMAAFWLAQLVIGCCLAKADLALATREGSVRAQVDLTKAAQGTAWEVWQVFKTVASAGDDEEMTAYRQMVLVRAQDPLCLFAWMWIPSGIVMAFLGGGCQKMTSWFWYLVVASIVATVATACIRDKFMATNKSDSPGDSKQ